MRNIQILCLLAITAVASCGSNRDQGNGHLKDESKDQPIRTSYNAFEIDSMLNFEIPLRRKSIFLEQTEFLPFRFDRKLVKSKNGECLLMTGNIGGTKNTFQYFEVFGSLEELDSSIEFLEVEEMQFIVSDFNNFETENGISLGISKNQLIEIKGMPHSTSIQNRIESVSYRVSDMKHSYLRKHNMPLYVMTLDFLDGKLVKFEFGFPEI